MDFLVTEKRRPLLLVEAKQNETDIAQALKKFQSQLGVPAVQLTDRGDVFRKVKHDGQTVLVAPAHLWLPRLP